MFVVLTGMMQNDIGVEIRKHSYGHFSFSYKTDDYVNLSVPVMGNKRETRDFSFTSPDHIFFGAYSVIMLV